MRSPLILVLLLVLGLGTVLFFAFRNGPGPDELGTMGGGQVAEGGLDAGTGRDLPQSPTTNVSGDRVSMDGGSEPGSSMPAVAHAPSTTDANMLLGQVVDAEGAPLPGCQVVFLTHGSGGDLWSRRGLEGLDGEPETATDEEGRFRLEDLAPGEDHALYVRHPEIALRIVGGVTVGTFGTYEEPPIVLRHGKRVRGKVETELGLPIEGALLHLDARWNPQAPTASLDRLSAVTDADGRYEILGVPDGTRCLTAQAKHMGTRTRVASLIFSDKTGQAHIVNFKLRGLAPLSGRVVDSEGAGVAGARVYAVGSDAIREVPNSHVLTVEDGSFQIEDVELGTYRLTVVAEGFADAVLDQVYAPIDDVTVTLRPRTMIRGTVVSGEDGSPVNAFSIRLRRYHSHETPSIPLLQTWEFRGTGGEFRVPAQDPQGTWVVEATSPGFAPTYSGSIVASADEGVDDVLIAMTRGGTIRGRIVDPSGAPVVGGSVTSRDDSWTDDPLTRAMGGAEADDATVARVSSDAEGRFVLPNLHAETYQVLLHARDLHEVKVRGVELAEGSDVDLGEIVLHEGASVRGVVYDANSLPVVGSLVFLKPVDSSLSYPFRKTRSLGDGSFAVRNVIPGAYLLSAQPPRPGMDPGLAWPLPGGEEVVLQGGIEDVRDVHLRDWANPAPPPPKPPTGQVGGKVLTADGTGRVGVAIELAPIPAGFGLPALAKSARGGEFAIVSVKPGDYELRVVDHPETAVQITVVADAWTRHDLHLGQ